MALFSVLFMQLAVAAYACPTITNTAEVASNAGWANADSHSDMGGCEQGVDEEQPALCFAYSQEGTQSLYKPAVPDVQPVFVIDIVRTAAAAVLDIRSDDTPAPGHWLTRASDPPLSIRNCCFRI